MGNLFCFLQLWIVLMLSGVPRVCSQQTCQGEYNGFSTSITYGSSNQLESKCSSWQIRNNGEKNILVLRVTRTQMRPYGLHRGRLYLSNVTVIPFGQDSCYVYDATFPSCDYQQLLKKLLACTSVVIIKVNSLPRKISVEKWGVFPVWFSLVYHTRNCPVVSPTSVATTKNPPPAETKTTTLSFFNSTGETNVTNATLNNDGKNHQDTSESEQARKSCDKTRDFMYLIIIAVLAALLLASLISIIVLGTRMRRMKADETCPTSKNTQSSDADEAAGNFEARAMTEIVENMAYGLVGPENGAEYATVQKPAMSNDE